MEYGKRLDAIRKGLEENKLDAFVTFEPVNFFYLSGFTGSSGAVVVTEKTATLFTDSRYITQSKEQIAESGLDLVIHKQPLIQEVNDFIKMNNLNTVGIEAGRLVVAQMQALETSGATITPLTNFVERIREIKDAEEISRIKIAIDVIEKVYAEMLTYVKPGMREVDIAMRMEMHMRELGASGVSFDTIVASGKRGALPHGQASNKVIESGDMVTVDMGALVNGYCSDMTRSFAVGTPNEKLVDIYNIVLDAQVTSAAALKPGMLGKEADKVARDIIVNAGFGEAFGHSLGHAVGIEVHELPGLSYLSDRVLEPGMILTSEPGIYIEDLGGIRIEDMILITEDGNENLMTLPKELIIV